MSITVPAVNNYVAPTKNQDLNTNLMSDSTSFDTTSRAATTGDNIQKNPYENEYIYDFIRNSRQIVPSITDMTVGNPAPQSNNTHTPWGIVCRNEFNNGIKMMTNSGIILWEQYIADHPNLYNRTDRFDMTVEATTFAEDQNAIIMLVRSYSASAGTFFYLISYDATSGLPIAVPGVDQTVTQYDNKTFNNRYSNNLSLAYNKYNQVLYVYTVTRASDAKRYFKAYSFLRSDPATPFRLNSTASFFKWRTSSSQPDNPSSGDIFIDLAIDQDTGLMFGMFQSESASLAGSGRSVYVVPFDSSFSSISGARGRYLNIPERFISSNRYYSSPVDVYRSDPHLTSNGYWYGTFYSNQSGRQKVYRYAIPLSTEYAPSVLEPNIEQVFSLNSSDVVAIDEYRNNVLIGHYNGNYVENKAYSYTDLTSVERNFTSTRNINRSGLNVVLACEPNDIEFKAINASLGHTEQYVDGGSSGSTTIETTVIPMIPIDYRSQLLNYTNSGNCKYPTEMTPEMLSGCSEAVLNDKKNQTPVTGDGLWAIFRKGNSNLIDTTSLVATGLVPNDGAGTLDFKISIPYSVNGVKFTSIIPNVHLSGFKKFTKTTITEKSVDVNRFNSVPAVAGTSGKKFRERNPDALDEIEIKRVLTSLINQKPVSFTPENIIIDKSTFIYDFQQGTITIPKVECNLWYNSAGELKTTKTTLINNIKLTGFYQGNETFFDPDETMIAPQNTIVEDFLKTDRLYPFLYSWLRNPPYEFDMNTDFEVDLTSANAVADAHEGTLTLKEVYLKKWIDNTGRIHNGERSKPYQLVINGFVKVPKKTSVRSTYVEYLPKLQPSEITDDHIKTVLKQISFNLPEKFSEANITFVSDPLKNNLDGTITVEPIYNLTYDDAGFITDASIRMGTVVLSGYKSVQPTTISDNWDIAGFEQYASDLASERDFPTLKKLLASNISYLPFYHENEENDFNIDADVIINPADVHPDNTTGSLEVTFKIRKYYDATGKLCIDDAFTPRKVTITGFRRIFGETRFEPTYQLGYTSVSPQSVTDKQLKKLMLYIGKNLRPDLKEADVIFKQVIRKPSEGTITVTPILPRYYDEKGNPQDISKEFPSIVLNGFKKVQPTSFDADRWIFGTSEMVAEKLAQPKNQPALKQMLYKKMINAPKGFSPDDIKIIQVNAFNRQGTITVSVRLQKYYDGNGFYKTDGKSPIFNLTISGFFTVYSKTDIPYTLDINNPWLSPQTISLPNLKRFLIANFTNLPPDFTIDNILLTKGGYEVSNLEGMIVIPHLVINYYFDQSLKMQTTQKTFSNIVIKGFKKTQATIIPNSDWDIGNNMIPASEFIKDEDAVKTLIASRIQNIPENFDPITDIKLSNYEVRNNLGSFKVTVTLNKYYDNNGLLLERSSTPQEIVISGFSIVNAATSFITRINSYLPNVQPSDLYDNDIKKILFDNISSPAPNLTYNDIGIDGYKVDNSNGTITVKPTLKRYYDINQVLQESEDTPHEFPEVIIYGFRQVKETTINNFWDYGNNGLIPEEALVKDPNYLGIRAIIANNVINKPIDFNQLTDIDIISTEALNTKGSIRIEFSLKKYYDKDGILQETGFPVQTIEITGYQSIEQTIIPTSGWNIGSQSYLASDFMKTDMQNTLKQMIYRRILNLPVGFNYKENIVFTEPLQPNNFKGELTVSIKIKQGYGSDFGKIDFAGESPNLNQTFTISGFYSQIQTTINPVVNVVNYHDFIPENISKNKKILTDIIYNNRPFIFANLPSDFLPSDIIAVDPIKVDNKSGSITVNLSIKNYYQEGNGNLINDTNKPLTKQVILNGFATSQASVFKNKDTIYLQSLSRDYASTYNAVESQWTEKWRRLIFDNLSQFMANLPDDFNPSDILSVNVSNINNISGSCDIEIKVKNFFNADATCSLQKEPAVYKYTVGGFKKNNKTEFNKGIVIREVNLESDIGLAQNYLASEVFNNNVEGLTLRSIVEDNIHQILNNLPGSFSESNIKTVTPKSYDNLTGELVATIGVTNYYNDTGINETVKTLEADVTISGFKKVDETSCVPSYLLSGLSANLATSLNDDQIKTLIYQYRDLLFKQSLPYCTLDEFKTYFNISNTEKNNVEAKLVVDAQLGIYYNKAGELVKDNTQAKPVSIEIQGFKQNSNNTVIRENVPLNNFSEALATNEVKDTNFIAATIISYKDNIFINSPAVLNTSDLAISNVETNNKLGTISFDLELYKYYDENGILIEKSPEPMTKHVTLSGFQQLNYTSIGSLELSDARNISAAIGSSQFSPSYYRDLNIDDAQQQLQYLLESRMSKGSINNKINNELVISDFNFDPSTANDTSNSLVVTFTLSNFITDQGLQVNPQTFTLTMTGFGTYHESTLSKDTLYYIMVAATIYLSVISSGVIGFIVWRGIRWKKGLR